LNDRSAAAQSQTGTATSCLCRWSGGKPFNTADIVKKRRTAAVENPDLPPLNRPVKPARLGQLCDGDFVKTGF
jgi:hypothetical protein